MKTNINLVMVHPHLTHSALPMNGCFCNPMNWLVEALVVLLVVRYLLQIITFFGMGLFVVWCQFVVNKVLAFLYLRKLSQVLMCVILLLSIVLGNHDMMIISIRYWSRVNIQMDTFMTLWSWDSSLFLHYKFLLHFMSIIPDCLKQWSLSSISPLQCFLHKFMT